MNRKDFLLLIFIYIVVRIPFLLAVHEPIGDELCQGAVVVEFLGGLHLPLWDYNIDPYGVGALLASFLTTPFFLLFGKTFFALKLVPFVWHIFSLIAWYFVFRTHFPKRQTFLILLFLALPLPEILQFMLNNNGFHFEMILWMALSILVFQKFLDGKLSEKWAGLGLGLLGGFSSMLALISLVTQATLWIYLGALKTNTLRKRIFYLNYFLGFVTSFFPWILLNLHNKGVGVLQVFYFFTPENGLIHFIKGFAGLFLKPDHGLQGLLGWGPAGGGAGRIAAVFFTLLYCFSLFSLVKRAWPLWKIPDSKMSLEKFALIFQFLLLILVAVERWGSSRYYYLFPLVPFMGMTMVSAISGFLPILKKPVFVFFLLAALVGNVQAVSWPDFGRTLSLQGYSYGKLCMALEPHVTMDPDLFEKRFLGFLKGRDLEIKKICFQNFNSGFYYTRDLNRIQRRRQFIENMEPELKPVLFEKLGEELGRYAFYDFTLLFSLVKELGIEEQYHPPVYYGVISGLSFGKTTLLEMFEAALPICKAAKDFIKPFCYKGLGMVEDDSHEQGKIASHAFVLRNLEPRWHPFYFKGLGRYFAYHFIYDPKRLKNLLPNFSDDEWTWFYNGIQEGISLEEDGFVRSEAQTRLALWRQR